MQLCLGVVEGMVQYMALFAVRCEEPYILLIVEAVRMPLSGAQGAHTPLQSHLQKILLQLELAM